VDHSNPEITRLLRAWEAGDQEALDRLTPLVYDELHRVAHRYMRRENPGNSLQTTALVNEAYLKLVDMRDVTWQDRTHFFAISATIIRRILVDAARARSAGRRGGDAVRMQLNESLDGLSVRAEELVRLDDALDALARIFPRKAKVVELRFFGGLTAEETAEVLKVSAKSVLRDWNFSRAWLTAELQ